MRALSQDPNGIEFEEKVTELIEVLERHARCHRELVEILETKRDTLVKMDYEQLEKDLEHEQYVIEKIGEIEAQRLDLTSELSGWVGSDSGAAMRIAELVTFVDDGGSQEELLDLRDELRDLADHLDRINSLNRTLTMRSIDHIHTYIALLGGKDPDAKTYTKMGIKEDESSALVVNRLV